MTGCHASPWQQCSCNNGAVPEAQLASTDVCQQHAAQDITSKAAYQGRGCMWLFLTAGGLPDLARAALEGVVPEPKERSATWLTSTYAVDDESPEAKLCSGGYQVT